MTEEQELAMERWIEVLGVPEHAKDATRKRFRALNLSASEIDADREAKMATIERRLRRKRLGQRP
jgi:hypothetical protein